ncbi:MAG: DUF2214 family protein [Acetobacteraceae bacterium]|nr:DUF2214 family protein [Acetobacteraceae bacterium]
MLDLHLAIAHHILIFAMFGVLVAESMCLQPGMTAGDVRRVSRIDLSYGVLAALILAVGFSRALFAAKGWEYYLSNTFFWLKIVTFVAIGLLSAPPTIALIRWRRSGTAPTGGEIAYVRRFIWAETILFVLLLIFAAAMARGYG